MDSTVEKRDALSRFMLKLSFFLPVAVFFPAFNYVIDPASVFTGGREERAIALELVNGHNVENFDDFDNRLVNRYFAEDFRGHPNVVVLGSSRVQSIHSDIFPGRRVLNASVQGGAFLEVLAMYQIVRQRNMRPETVVFGIDPWMLTPIDPDPRTFVLADLLQPIQEALGVTLFEQAKWHGLGRIHALLSPSYFQNSVQAVVRQGGKPRWKSSSSEWNHDFTSLPDGSVTSSEPERTADSAEVLRRAVEVYGTPVYTMPPREQVDSAHVHALERFVEMMKRDGAQVLLYEAPYHPAAFEAFSRDARGEVLKNADSVIQRLAKKESIPVLGSYDPHRYGLSGADFYDGHHPRESAVYRIFQTFRK